jgi:hypothetical protein
MIFIYIWFFDKQWISFPIIAAILHDCEPDKIVTAKECCLLQKSENTFTSLISYKYCVMCQLIWGVRTQFNYSFLYQNFRENSVLQSVDTDALKNSTLNIKWLILFKLALLYTLKTFEFSILSTSQHIYYEMWPLQNKEDRTHAILWQF